MKVKVVAIHEGYGHDAMYEHSVHETSQYTEANVKKHLHFRVMNEHANHDCFFSVNAKQLPHNAKVGDEFTLEFKRMS